MMKESVLLLLLLYIQPNHAEAGYTIGRWAFGLVAVRCVTSLH